MSIDIKAFLTKTFLTRDKQDNQAVAPHLRTINLYDPQFKKVQPITKKVRELVFDCNQPHRHWLDKLPMPANIDDRRKLVQLRNSFPKDATLSNSMLA